MEEWEYHVSHRAIVDGQGDLPYPGLGNIIDAVYILPAGMSKAALQLAILKENRLYGSYLKWDIRLSNVRIKPITPGEYVIVNSSDGGLLRRIDNLVIYYLHGHKVLGADKNRLIIKDKTQVSLNDFF